jgi:hypothetical protein
MTPRENNARTHLRHARHDGRLLAPTRQKEAIQRELPARSHGVAQVRDYHALMNPKFLESLYA